MHSRPTTFVLIPCYNGEKFLERSVLSLINQSRLADRIYIIDDGSTDSSRSIIESLAERFLSVTGIFHPKNRGRAARMNKCFDEFDPTYFILQDADDVAHPNRIERQLLFLESHPEVVCSSSFVRYINSEGKPIGKGQLNLTTTERLQSYLISDDPFGLFCPAVVLRGSAIKDPDLRFRQQFWPADDIDLWNRIAEAGFTVMVQPEYLVDYRVHGTSAVTSSFRRTREKFEFVRACLRARRRGSEEPSWEAFLITRAARSLPTKINDWRKTTAKGLYRNGGFRWGDRKRLQAIGSLFLAGCLQPGYVLNRLWKQHL